MDHDLFFEEYFSEKTFWINSPNTKENTKTMTWFFWSCFTPFVVLTQGFLMEDLDSCLGNLALAFFRLALPSSIPGFLFSFLLLENVDMAMI